MSFVLEEVKVETKAKASDTKTPGATLLSKQLWDQGWETLGCGGCFLEEMTLAGQEGWPVGRGQKFCVEGKAGR